MGTLVMKFGGTSVGSVDAINQTADIILDSAKEWRRLVVVSAMNGVTDALIDSAQTAVSSDDELAFRAIIAGLHAKHHDTIGALLPEGKDREQLFSTVQGLMDELGALCHSIHILGEITPRAMDTITSMGERMSARTLAAVLRHKGTKSQSIDATQLIVTDDKYQNAAPLMEKTLARIQERLVSALDAGVIPIVTGFIGATEEGVTTTLGRGGTDYSAAILGSCLDADEVWNWKEVDGVLTTDPRIVPDAQVIPELSYSEMGELSYFGAKVLHPKTVLPLIQHNIPLRVKNTFNPTYPGTRIVREAADEARGKIKAVTAIKGMSMVIVEGRGMIGVPGIAARTFSTVAGQGANVLMIIQASSEQSICFLIPTQTVSAVVKALEEEMERELARRDIDRISSRDNVVIVTAVGAGLRDTPGISAKVFGALGQADINVVAIAQGSSECGLSLVVAAADAVDAVRQIHSQVIVNGG
ncbi:MAG: aspartate kinase [Anaerolineae bacterium]|nr:aspartate kinase [Anaerolineae bacterium]